MNSVFYPKSVAVIGASREPMAVGHGIVQNLINGGVFQTEYNRPFKGKIFLINPNADEILGIKCNKTLADVKDDIDLAIIAVPSKFVASVVRDCVKKKVKGVIIISAGFAEIGSEGKKLQDEISNELKKANIPLIGPNCLGMINTFAVNASFAPAMPPQGSIAFVSQSGALADSVIDWAIAKNYGFSKIISVGNGANLDVSDFIEYLSDDKETKSIAMYIEALKDGRKFMAAAKKCKKPIVVLKAGKTEAGRSAISSHTGSLAGSYKVYEAAFSQCGVKIAKNVEELFEQAQLLSMMPRDINNSVAIITNGGGCGVLAADRCKELGINLSKLSKETMDKLDKSGKMHPAYSKGNPLDLIGDALSERYEAALDAVLSQEDVGAAIVIQTLQTMTQPIENAKAIINAQKKYPGKPILAVFMGGTFTREGKHYLEVHNVPVYLYPEKAVEALSALIKK
ncbi:MAG: CoA-binding protein [Candidatus Woesearchaeota archaeon]